MTWIDGMIAALAGLVVLAVYVAVFVALVVIERLRQQNRLRAQYNRIIAGLEAMADRSYFPVPANPGSVIRCPPQKGE